MVDANGSVSGRRRSSGASLSPLGRDAAPHTGQLAASLLARGSLIVINTDTSERRYF